MKMRRFLICIILIAFISSCDYYGEYEFRIENRLSAPIIVSFKNQELWDSVTNIVVYPGTTVIAATAGSENLGMNEKLHSIFSDTVTVLKDLKIKVDNAELKKNFQLGKEWDYELKETQHGVYTLKIDSADLTK